MVQLERRIAAVDVPLERVRGDLADALRTRHRATVRLELESQLKAQAVITIKDTRFDSSPAGSP